MIPKECEGDLVVMYIDEDIPLDIGYLSRILRVNGRRFDALVVRSVHLTTLHSDRKDGQEGEVTLTTEYWHIHRNITQEARQGLLSPEECVRIQELINGSW